ncbi:MAG: hypothetical protein MJZ10_01375 [Fibrobacter sp.]|nr:hypothetical protein [Fibrobacter sp.]
MFFTRQPFYATALLVLSTLVACTTDNSASQPTYDSSNDYIPDLSQNSCKIETIGDSKISITEVYQGSVYSSIVYDVTPSAVLITQDIYITPLATNSQFQDYCDEFVESGDYDTFTCSGRHLSYEYKYEVTSSVNLIRTNLEKSCETFYKENPVIEPNEPVEFPTNKNSCFITRNTDTDFKMEANIIGIQKTTTTIKYDGETIQLIQTIQFDPATPADTISSVCEENMEIGSTDDYDVTCGEDFVRIYYSATVSTTTKDEIVNSYLNDCKEFDRLGYAASAMLYSSTKQNLR